MDTNKCLSNGKRADASAEQMNLEKLVEQIEMVTEAHKEARETIYRGSEKI
ncbi:hypothetical protein [Rhizobium sp. BK376]|uniref:hypothetical protein n=1 Tax=Rhizobium sp. BK376 TaxID=2512149 RepID=UPI0010E61C48|nr:hypothetical protein [Rhizobium sp. BK376]TCR69237.1 hypothetical protein EV561_14313 [Rhizobium sp. BK376]